MFRLSDTNFWNAFCLNLHVSESRRENVLTELSDVLELHRHDLLIGLYGVGQSQKDAVLCNLWKPHREAVLTDL
jgi:hypothetical protein